MAENKIHHIPADDPNKVNLTVDFIKYHRLDEGAIKSADQFYTEGIGRVLNALIIHTSQGDVRLENHVVESPSCKEIDGDDCPIFPYEAICRQITYGGKLMIIARMYPKLKDGSISPKPSEEARKCIGNIPIMIKSTKCNLYGFTEQELIRKKECPFMLGGYFIYKGGLKSIISQEELATNQVFKFHIKKTGGMKCEMRFVRKDYSHTHITVRYDIKTKLFYVVLPFLKGGKHPEMDEEGVTVAKASAASKTNISLGIFFKYFDIEMDDMIKMIKTWHSKNSKCKLAFISRVLEPTVEEAYLCRSAEDEFIKKLNAPNASRADKLEKIKTHLNREFFDGLEYLDKNLNMIAMMTCRLIQVIAGDPIDDRDSYINKRSDMAGVIMNDLFRTLSMKLVRDVQEVVDNSNSMYPFEIVVKNLTDKTITNGFGLALASGNFNKTGFGANSKDGVSQVLLYNSLPCMISQIRRRNKPLDKNGKMIGPRQLHNMQWGIICPSETPEGSPCGLTNNSSIVEIVSLYRDLSALPHLLADHIHSEPSDEADHALMINGMWEGWVNKDIIDLVRLWRLEGGLPFDVSISTTLYNEIKINGDSGRSTRPCLIIGKSGKTVLEEKLGTLDLSSKGCSWEDVIKMQAVEYIDKAEEENLHVAVSPWDVRDFHTHCEIDASAIFGYCANLIPLPSNNPGPRISYECSMLKQAIGTARLNEKYCLDTNAKVLDYPQKYIVETDIARASGLDELGMGQVPIVAVFAASNNQEDSIVVNKAAIDRGLFRTTVYKTTKEIQKTSEREFFCNPVPILYADENSKKKRKNYHLIEREEGQREHREIRRFDGKPDFLDDEWTVSEVKGGVTFYKNPKKEGWTVQKTVSEKYTLEIKHIIPYEEESTEGAPKVGCRVAPGDVLIGKIKYVDDKPIDCSVIHRGTDTGVIDTVMMTQDGDGNLIMDVKVRYYRIPKMGDKFAQRHAQKGIIGLIAPEADLPFSSEGMIADVYINPHAFPSRMTMGYILELLCNKEGCIKGRRHQGTAFRDTETMIENVQRSLKESGYSPGGKEVMYCGKTGQMLKCNIFMGPVGYQVLKHQVDDKMHARAKGPVQRLTRQPVEGRSRNGGLRFGEMESQCFTSYGSTAFLQERLLKVSDEYDVTVCTECGYIAIDNKKVGVRCLVCSKKGLKTDFVKITIPFPLKLLSQDLMACNIAFKFKINKDELTGKYEATQIVPAQGS